MNGVAVRRGSTVKRNSDYLNKLVSEFYSKNSKTLNSVSGFGRSQFNG